MFILYKNTKIHFSSIGQGTTVFLLHGFLENSSMWTGIYEQISKKCRVICVDLLGHGATENCGYIHTMEEQAEIVKAIFNHLHLRKCILIGHSMGGYVALAFAKLYPKNVKGLCLMNSTALPDSDEKKVNRDRAILVVKKNYKSFVKIAIPMLFSEQNRTIFTSEIEKITHEALQTSPQGIIAALEGMKVRQNQTSILKEAIFPIQMIIGKQDPALDYDTLIAQTKDTKVQIVEFLDGHMSHVENKYGLICAFQNFVKSC